MHKAILKQLGSSVARNLGIMGFTNDGKKMSHRQGLDLVAKTCGMVNWQSVVAFKAQTALDAGGKAGVLVQDHPEQCANDYILRDDERSCWVRVGGIAVNIIRTDEGVVVNVWNYGNTSGGSLASAHVFNVDAEAALCEENDIDIDEVAEWVGLHYKVNFDTESWQKRYEWIERYIESVNGDNMPEVGELVPTSCPHCGENTDATVESVTDNAVKLVCTDCGERFTETTTQDAAASTDAGAGQADMPYFASQASGSSEYAEAVRVGLVSGEDDYYQLQRNDELGVYPDDAAAIEAALDAEAKGDAYAVAQLQLAKTDLAVAKARKRRAEAACRGMKDPVVKVRPVDSPETWVEWQISQNLTDRWGNINFHNAARKPLEPLTSDGALLDYLRSQMWDEMTFVVRKDGQYGILFECEYCSIESEQGMDPDPDLKPHSEMISIISRNGTALAQQYPGVQFSIPDEGEIIEERPALWAFVPDGLLSAEQRQALGMAMLTL